VTAPTRKSYEGGVFTQRELRARVLSNRRARTDQRLRAEWRCYLGASTQRIDSARFVHRNVFTSEDSLRRKNVGTPEEMARRCSRAAENFECSPPRRAHADRTRGSRPFGPKFPSRARGEAEYRRPLPVTLGVVGEIRPIQAALGGADLGRASSRPRERAVCGRARASRDADRDCSLRGGERGLVRIFARLKSDAALRLGP